MAREKQDDILKSIQAASTEAQQEPTDPPDYVEVEGVRYYRQKPVEQTDYSVVVKDVEERDPKTGLMRTVQKRFERILINLAPHAADIKLDGRIYFANFTYDFSPEQAATVRDIMARTWDHERSTGGANVNMAGARSHAFSMNGGATRTQLGAPGIAGI